MGYFRGSLVSQISAQHCQRTPQSSAWRVYWVKYFKHFECFSLLSLKGPQTLCISTDVCQVSLVASVLFFVAAAANALSASTTKEALMQLRFMLGVYSGMAAMMTLRRKAQLIECVRGVVEVAADVERIADRYPHLMV